MGQSVRCQWDDELSTCIGIISSDHTRNCSSELGSNNFSF